MKTDFYQNFKVVKKISEQELRENSYLIADTKTNNAIVIDPGYDSEYLIRVIENEGYSLKYILITHAHHDHIAGVQAFSEYFSLPCTIHLEDKRMLMHSSMYSIRFARRQMDRPNNIQWLSDKLLGELEQHGIYILHTPGHSRGSICIFFQHVIFTGDTLVKNYLGRTDLPEGDKTKILQSVDRLINKGRKMNSLMLYPGHGENWSLLEAQQWWNNHKK